jgi:hypothetical protein
MGNRGGLMFSWPAEAVPKKAAKAAQWVVFNYSAALTEVFRAFPQLQGDCQGIQKGHGPPSPIMEAISQSDPNISGFNPQRAIQPKSFSRRTRCLMGQSPTSSKNPWSGKVKAKSRRGVLLLHPILVPHRCHFILLLLICQRMKYQLYYSLQL